MSDFAPLKRTEVGRYLRRAVATAAALALMGAASVQAQPGGALPAELQSRWNATKLPQSALSLVVREVDGPTILQINGNLPRNPASVMKMVTTWAGLAGLGPDYRWRTTLLARSGARVDAQGTLSGPLYVKAAGDPFLTTQELWALLRDLRLRGVKNLTEVVLDRSIFGPVAINPNDFDASGDRPYNASPDALMVDLGAMRVLFQPDAAARKWVPVLDPPLPGVRVTGAVQWSDAVCPGSPTIDTQVINTGKEVQVQVAGQAAGSCGEFSVYRLIQTQPRLFSAVFESLWKELGGTLGKGISEGRVPANAQALVWTESESLADTIRVINKRSNNVMARNLLLTLGAEASGPGATSASGAQAALAILQSQGVDTRGWHIDNGAGLSRTARVTANGLADMLQAAWRSPLMPEFVSSLAISGVDGTVRRRLRNGEARGMAHLKTGTLRDTRAIAGYVLGTSGKRYVVVSIVNNGNAPAVRPFDDALISWLVSR